MRGFRIARRQSRLRTKYYPRDMAQQREGWPLGLQPVNVRVGLGRNNREHSTGSISFNTLLTGSPTSSTDSSSDLDTESTGSFFHDRSITLGSLMGASTMLEVSRRSTRIRIPEAIIKNRKSSKPRIWLFSLCSGVSTDVENMDNAAAQSLGHFLAVERKAANQSRRIDQNPAMYGPDEIIIAQRESGASNSLFVDGRVAPPRASPGVEEGEGGYGVSLILCCACGNGSH